MSDSRIIKKYPNRRLYDTGESRYITLSDIRSLVLTGVEFQVQDSNSGEDLTRSILLQIIMEEESNDKPIFSVAVLSQLIRFYGGTVQGVFAQYLEESLSMFAKQQNMFTPTAGQDPLQNVSKLAQQNMKMWSDMQKAFLQSTGLGDRDDKDGK
ncbi:MULTISPECIES: polyhydroxyalkanoate synthesis repressor PhaR [Thalassomonas]|uniref:Polyhydroxyalkanoate synthesis repressor PhaR n=1 Tax=Thalassomonas actiniarum TaxID=485447 RepID=A0AAE9YL59_9GAMM|nr:MULTISPECIES: polyhydroxyalkanoate synthesis repressor PhaR [Thalassomonas]WDD97475.1 polyhydroxyalkanoate synthesis repressor PhaR [Thalassomonas actiniarum]